MHRWLGKLAHFLQQAKFAGFPNSQKTVGATWWGAVWLLALVVLANRVGTMVVPFLALYLTTELKIDTATGGKLLSLFGLGALLGGYWGGWLTTKFRTAQVQAGMLICEALTLIIIARTFELPQIAAGLFFLGLFSEAFRPANATAMTNACPTALRPRAFALNRMAINIGMSIGPAIGGVLASHNYEWLFYVDATTCIAASVLVLCLFW